MSLAKTTIGAKIFGAFIAMSALIALLGAAGYGALSLAGQTTVTTFDGPLMAINYARAAQADFIMLKMAELRFEHADETARAAITAEIGELASTFADDLAVAEQRSIMPDEKRLIREIRPLVARWRASRTAGDIAALEEIDRQVDAKFDLLIELNTDHSFIGRRKAVDNVATYKYLSAGATLLALLLGAGITLFLRKRIVRPLSAAATVADRIAKGELQTEIPPGGADETGALLKSMTVMQDNIRAMMVREKGLRLSAESRLSDALETSREGVILAGPEGTILLANRQLREFFPAVAAELVSGTNFADALRLIRTQLGAGAEGEIGLSGHRELELADGRWVRVTANPTSEGGSILFFSDFTAIKEREENLRAAKREAEEANAAKTRFLANMSHELRTPLNAIIGFSEILNGQLFGEIGNARYLNYSGDILRSGRHLLDVINSVLDLSKSEAGKMVLNVRDVDMRDILGDCAVMVGEQAAGAGLDFAMRGADAGLPLKGDPAKLRQIFLNLLSNAIKFTPEGGRVWVEARQDGAGVTVTVGDSGIGMSPDDVTVALTPFGQVDNRLERRYEGTGLGLPLTKALIELHGGRLSFESARGSGTRAMVRFPAAAATPLAEAG
jgi:signal transduction histidine kinase/HAMP domain-containing protein